MTLMEQNVRPETADEGAVKASSETFSPHQMQDTGMLLNLVGVGWDDRSMEEMFRGHLSGDPDPEIADEAYQLARKVVFRDRLDETSCQLLETLIDVMERSGWVTELLLVVTRVGGLAGVSDALRRKAARSLLSHGSVMTALPLVQELPGSEDRALAARCYELLGDQEGVFDAAQGALSLLPGNAAPIPLVTQLAAAAVATGRPEAALNALRRVPKAERTRDLLILEARAREMSGDLKGAARPLRLLLERDATDDAARSGLIELLLRSGQSEAARSVYRDGLPHLAARLPETADELFEEPSRFSPSDPVPEAALNWMARVAGEVPDAWQARELIAFDRALLTWVQSRPDRIRELSYRVRLSEAAQAMVMDMHLRGGGVLIAPAHAGLMNAAPLVMSAAGVRFGLVPPETLLDLPGLSDHLIQVQGRSRGSVIRELIRRLRSGEAVACAADEISGSRYRAVEVLDTTVPVSNLIPRLSERVGVPSFFPRVLPGEGGVITVDLRPLPVPTADLSGERFQEIWAGAWARELEGLLRSAPYAMRGTGGFWDALADA